MVIGCDVDLQIDDQAIAQQCVQHIVLALINVDTFQQLNELLGVRHSVFIVGDSGTGKTNMWKTLFRTYHNQNLKPSYTDLNPKAVTNDELYGIINPATRDTVQCCCCDIRCNVLWLI